MFNVDETISKSLDEVEEMIRKSEELIQKSIPPEEVSNDTPVPQEGGAPEEGMEEGATGEEPPVEEEGGEGMEEPPVDDDEVEKSLVDNLEEDGSVKKALEVSDFLSALVKGVSDILSQNTESVSKSLQTSDKSNELLAKSFEGITKSQGAIIASQMEVLKSVRELAARINKVESTPQVRKSMVSTPAYIEKSFGGASQGEKLSKSEAVTRLAQACATQPELTTDVLALESTGDFNMLSPGAKSILNM